MSNLNLESFGLQGARFPVEFVSLRAIQGVMISTDGKPLSIEEG